MHGWSFPQSFVALVAVVPLILIVNPAYFHPIAIGAVAVAERSIGDVIPARSDLFLLPCHGQLLVDEAWRTSAHDRGEGMRPKGFLPPSGPLLEYMKLEQ